MVVVPLCFCIALLLQHSLCLISLPQPHALLCGMTKLSTFRLLARSGSSFVPESEDPYEDIVNMNKTVEQPDAYDLSASNSFRSEVYRSLSAEFPAMGTFGTNTPASALSVIERHLGDLDAVPSGDDQWVAELRDIVELKRGEHGCTKRCYFFLPRIARCRTGVAIWSKRSEQDLKKEAKKAVANNGLNIPASVAYVINAVYIDKICTLSELRSEDGVAYAEYKRWVREQREKRKQDPLPAVKQELVKVTIAHLYCDVTATCTDGVMILHRDGSKLIPLGDEQRVQ
jgi:hypothetical protein